MVIFQFRARRNHVTEVDIDIVKFADAVEFDTRRQRQFQFAPNLRSQRMFHDLRRADAENQRPFIFWMQCIAEIILSGCGLGRAYNQIYSALASRPL